MVVAPTPQARRLVAGEDSPQEVELGPVLADEVDFLRGDLVPGWVEVVDVDEELGEEELEFVGEGFWERGGFGLGLFGLLFFLVGWCVCLWVGWCMICI